MITSDNDDVWGHKRPLCRKEGEGEEEEQEEQEEAWSTAWTGAADRPEARPGLVDLTALR